MPSNQAAWLPALNTPLEVKEAPYTPPGEHDVVVRNQTIAINPVDAVGMKVFSWLNFPSIAGGDVSGEVVEVGSGVTRLKVGDRVVGFAAGVGTNDTHRSGFQKYSVLYANNTIPIPDSMSYERAVVLPLTMTTATIGLFGKKLLGLPYPSLEPKSTGKTLLIWGGSTSVGCSAIQLAIAAGFEVISTASPKNYEFVKRVGAKQVFDYNDKEIVAKLVKAFEGKTSAGAMCIAGVDPEGRKAAQDACYEFVAKTEGTKFVSLAAPPIGAAPYGVGSAFILTDVPYDKNEALEFIFTKYLPQALSDGKFIPLPEPMVVGHGLESIQKALEVVEKGVSASKVVVTL